MTAPGSATSVLISPERARESSGAKICDSGCRASEISSSTVSKANMPESAYPTIQQGATVPTIAVSNILITRADMDERLTEWVTRTVIDSRDRIGAHVHSAQLVDLRTAIYTAPLVLHEGARRYYRSVKP